MQTSDVPKKHWNLYYILKMDQQEHPMPQEAVRQIQQKLAEILSEKNRDIGCETKKNCDIMGTYQNQQISCDKGSVVWKERN